MPTLGGLRSQLLRLSQEQFLSYYSKVTFEDFLKVVFEIKFAAAKKFETEMKNMVSLCFSKRSSLRELKNGGISAVEVI